MKIEWTLSKPQIFGLAAYSAIFPLSLLLSEPFGDWILLLGFFISLPLAPLGFLAFWVAASGGTWFALLFTWVFNFFQGCIFLESYISKMRKAGRKPRPFLRLFVPTVISIIALFAAIAVISEIT